MRAVIDNSCLQALVQARVAMELGGMFDELVIPEAVAVEAGRPRTHHLLRRFIASPPEFVSIRPPATSVDGQRKDWGDREAIQHCMENRQLILLCDDRKATNKARGLGLDVHGSIWVLKELDRRQICHIDEARDHLVWHTEKDGGFRYPVGLLDQAVLECQRERALEHEIALLRERQNKISDVLSAGKSDDIYGLSREALWQELDQAKDKKRLLDEIERKITNAKACNERMDRNAILIRQREWKEKALMSEPDHVAGAPKDPSTSSEGAEAKRQQDRAAQNQKEQDEQKKRRDRER